eukprot:scaffold7340_cov266-Pinguiococcus_pyrenoidosus.AAC.14
MDQFSLRGPLSSSRGQASGIPASGLLRVCDRRISWRFCHANCTMSAVYNDTQSAAMQQLCERSVKEQFRIGKAHAEQLGVRLDSLLSLRSSIFARHVRQTAGSHRSRSREYAQRFADGEAIPAMASRWGSRKKRRWRSA